MERAVKPALPLADFHKLADIPLSLPCRVELSQTPQESALFSGKAPEDGPATYFDRAAVL
jgi:hypothetical protein